LQPRSRSSVPPRERLTEDGVRSRFARYALPCERLTRGNFENSLGSAKAPSKTCRTSPVAGCSQQHVVDQPHFVDPGGDREERLARDDIAHWLHGGRIDDRTINHADPPAVAEQIPRPRAGTGRTPPAPRHPSL